jgi:hypothetical protein
MGLPIDIFLNIQKKSFLLKKITPYHQYKITRDFFIFMDFPHKKLFLIDVLKF